MRTSLNEIQQAETYLQGNMAAEDSVVFETCMLLNPAMHANVLLQKQVYHLVLAYSHKQLKAELETVHNKLFREQAHTGFRERIFNIFRK